MTVSVRLCVDCSGNDADLGQVRCGSCLYRLRKLRGGFDGFPCEACGVTVIVRVRAKKGTFCRSCRAERRERWKREGRPCEDCGRPTGVKLGARCGSCLYKRQSKSCEVEGCSGKFLARGFCPTHYSEWYIRENGRPESTYQPREHDLVCVVCDEAYVGLSPDRKYCSGDCQYVGQYGRTRVAAEAERAAEREAERAQSVVDLRGPLRRALEDGGDIMPEVRARTTVTPSGCWEWNHRLDKEGYPYYRYSVRGRSVEVAMHRAVLESEHGKSLGDQAAHHVCANRSCINPDHLQPVTHRANNAEMLARTFLFDRVARLEDELAKLDPDNPLLGEISIPR